MFKSDSKKAIWGLVFAAVLLLSFGLWFFFDRTGHIEDSNGAEDISLASISEQQILERKIGPKGLESDAEFPGTMVKFYSEKYSGIYEVMYTTVLFTPGFSIDIYDFEVNSGNFRMVLINEDRIVAEVLPGEHTSLVLEDALGPVSLVIAGESADFSFRIPQTNFLGITPSSSGN